MSALSLTTRTGDNLEDSSTKNLVCIMHFLNLSSMSKALKSLTARKPNSLRGQASTLTYFSTCPFGQLTKTRGSGEPVSLT